MLKKLLITTIVAVLMSNVYADTEIDQDTDVKPQMVIRSKPGLVDKYFKIATALGAGVSQCPTLTEIIRDGWPEARYLMVVDMMSMNIKQEDAVALIDRTFNGAASMPPDSHIVKNCDMILDLLYQFDKDASTIRSSTSPEKKETDSTTTN